MADAGMVELRKTLNVVGAFGALGRAVASPIVAPDGSGAFRGLPGFLSKGTAAGTVRGPVRSMPSLFSAASAACCAGDRLGGASLSLVTTCLPAPAWLVGALATPVADVCAEPRGVFTWRVASRVTA